MCARQSSKTVKNLTTLEAMNIDRYNNIVYMFHLKFLYLWKWQIFIFDYGASQKSCSTKIYIPKLHNLYEANFLERLYVLD